MTADLGEARIRALIDDLRGMAAETSWVEFKHNNAEPEMIGKLISAVANSARLADEAFGYVLWGVEDAGHAAVGTTFDPTTQTVGAEPLEFWLARRLQPSVDFSFTGIVDDGVRLVLLLVPAASTNAVEYDRTPYLRIGSATPRLSDYPERQRALWAKLQAYAWESGVAQQFVTGDDVLRLLDHTAYFDLTRQPLPDNRDGIFARLETERLIHRDVGGRWNITNLGAILFARRLSEFPPSMARKAVRFVAYGGPNRASAVSHRQDGQRGYACGFEGLVTFIDGLLPKNEHIGKAFREEQPLYPAVALRGLIANALIHQDMTVTGAGPLIEMFNDRLEITNPGQPLIQPERFLDSPPRSRNEMLASLMRRMRLCEEQGTGIDKVIWEAELHQLPPPDFRLESEAVKVVLFAPRGFADMTPDERIRACYQHAALKYVSGQRMKNSTLCERFGIERRNAAQASAVIGQALKVGLIRPADPEHPRAGYVPFWA